MREPGQEDGSQKLKRSRGGGATVNPVNLVKWISSCKKRDGDPGSIPGKTPQSTAKSSRTKRSLIKSGYSVGMLSKYSQFRTCFLNKK